MKTFLKKSWKYLIFIPIIALVIVGIFLAIPDENNKPLSIEANDLLLKVGEKKTVSYSVSIEQAVCDFDIDNEDVAIVSGGEILGVNEGETELTITAKYGNEISNKVVNVVVEKSDLSDGNENQNPDENEPSNPEIPNVPENPDTPNDGDNVEDNNPTEDDENEDSNGSDEQVPENDVDIKLYVNGVLAEDIVLTSGKVSLLRIEASKEFSLISNNLNLIMEELKGVPNTFKISSQSIGVYSLIIKGENFEKTVVVNVQ